MKTALITGASGGIGYELAKLFAHDRYNVVLIARSAEKLSQLADELQRQFGITAKAITLDLATPGAAKQLFDQLSGTPIDVLVNNAAYGIFGEFAEQKPDDISGQIELNIAALSMLTRLFVPQMIERKSGKILNIASTAGFQAGPLMAVYYASKAYVISFSEAIANELKGSGVTVTCLCPGPTDTGFQGRAGVANSRLFKQFGPMSAKAVARDGYRAMMKGKTLTISGFKNRVLAETTRVAPRKLATAVSRWVAEEKK
ncbi:MAG TPA: SDR family oxidoreductase [Terriglobales bacterium]|nr:SDR family oxidoreductase [Terriglobales bacterium]